MKVIDYNVKYAQTFWLVHEAFGINKGHQTIVRPSPSTYEDVLKAFKAGTMVQMNGAIAWKEAGETDAQFEVLLAAAGIQVDFEVFETYDGLGNCIDYTIVDKNACKAVLSSKRN